MFEDNDTPIADAGADQIIICTASGATLGGSNTSTGANFSYSWTNENGTVVSSNQTVTVSDPGGYTLEVTNTSNGCVSVDTAQVECSCIEYLNITANPIPSGTFKAVHEVKSGSLVPANGVVNFNAGDEVKLLPGFKVEANSNFKAMIEVCQ